MHFVFSASKPVVVRQLKVFGIVSWSICVSGEHVVVVKALCEVKAVISYVPSWPKTLWLSTVQEDLLD